VAEAFGMVFHARKGFAPPPSMPLRRFLTEVKIHAGHLTLGKQHLPVR
jgi:hypothetical protein